jgi:hypothetical protein
VGERRRVRRIPLRDAADALGVSKDAVRQRIRRGTLQSDKGEDGRVYVYLDASVDDVQTPERADSGVVDELRDRVGYLERQVEEERDARRRADTLLARLMDRLPELEAPSDARGSPQGAAEEPESAEPRSDVTELEKRVEGNKLAMEAARTQLLVGSGLLVGMGAVVGIMPNASRASPILYAAFALVVLSVYVGIMWMREIAAAMGRSERHPLQTEVLPNIGGVSSLFFILGLGLFSFYVVFNHPGDDAEGWRGSWIVSPDTTSEQGRWLAAFLALVVIVLFVGYFARWRRKRKKRAQQSEPPSNSA